MPKSADYMNLPFDDAIAYFRQKTNLPTATWKDIWKDMYARGFVIAGGMKDEFLADMRSAVGKGIASGTTLAEFRKDFDRIVEKHGWKYKGGRGWRTGVIFNTNLSTAYAAGHWKQMTDKDVVNHRPYLRYVPSHADRKRPEHVKLYNLVLRYDDPFWDTHSPPNGWGCKCGLASLSERELDRYIEEEKNSDYPINTTAPEIEYYDWTDKATGKAHQVPKGIDPGWDYNVGKAAWGKNEALRLMEDSGPWVDLNPWTPGNYGLPDSIPVDMPKAGIGVRAGTEKKLRDALKAVLGGKASKTFTDPAGGVVMVSDAIVDHMLEKPGTRWDGREMYFPFIPELIEDPSEIWIGFAKSEISGRVAVRKKYIKTIRISKDTVLGMWAEVQSGMWVTQDLFRGGNTAQKNLRKGRLIWSRE